MFYNSLAMFYKSSGKYMEGFGEVSRKYQESITKVLIIIPLVRQTLNPLMGINYKKHSTFVECFFYLSNTL